MLGVWIQISGFLSDSTKTTIPKILFPLNAKIRRISASVCPPNRATREVLPFSNNGHFFIKGGIFSGAGCFFQAAFPAPCGYDTPCGAGVYFFCGAAASVFRAARGGKASIRGGVCFFWKHTNRNYSCTAEPAFCKKISGDRTHRIPRYGNFRAAPPPPAGRTRPQTRHPQPKRPYPPSPSESPDCPHACRPSCPHVACPLPTRPPTPHTPCPSDHRLSARPSTRRTAPVCPSRRARTLAQQAPTYRARLSVRSVRALARRTAYARPTEPAICQIRKCFRRTTC